MSSEVILSSKTDAWAEYGNGSRIEFGRWCIWFIGRALYMLVVRSLVVEKEILDWIGLDFWVGETIVTTSFIQR